MISRLSILVTAVLLLVACQQAPVRDEGSTRSRISVGSQVILHQALPVPAGHARVFLQHGQVVDKMRLDRYQPHCNFEVRTLSVGHTVIAPESFMVTALLEDEEEVVRGPEWRRYASLLGGLDDMQANRVSRFVHHTLYAAAQPDVMRLTCHGGFADPWQAEYPSVSEIRRALGELITIRVQGGVAGG